MLNNSGRSIIFLKFTPDFNQNFLGLIIFDSKIIFKKINHLKKIIKSKTRYFVFKYAIKNNCPNNQ